MIINVTIYYLFRNTKDVLLLDFKIKLILKSWKYIEVYRTTNLYCRPVFTSFGLAYGLADFSFYFMSYIYFSLCFKVIVNRY